MKIIITGDIHGEFSIINRLINRKQPDVLIICGDFGFWPDASMYQSTYGYYYSAREDNFDILEIKNQNSKIYWVPGNHEHWDNLEKEYGRRGLKPIPMKGNENIFYCPIGSTETFNGDNFLFAGGADSVDKQHRTIGVDWFPQETLNHEDWEYIIERHKNTKIDTIISHTCPSSFEMRDTFNMKHADFSRKVLEELLQEFKPMQWYFGHWHVYKKQYKNTIWTCLDHNKGEGVWWEYYHQPCKTTSLQGVIVQNKK